MARRIGLKTAIAAYGASLALGWLCDPLLAQEKAGTGPTELIVVRLIHPENQADALIRLFDGGPAPHPAAALAAWKRASRAPGKLGKPAEALISFFNPEMVRELSTFHDAVFQLGLVPDTGAPRWTVFVPNDDGSVDSMITSLRLSGGAAEAPFENGRISVERLGGPGKAVAARDPQGHGVILASSRAELEQALRRGRPNDFPDGAAGDSGAFFRIEPGQSGNSPSGSLPVRRAIELLRGLGCRCIEGRAGLHGGRLELETRSRVVPPRLPGPAVMKRRRLEPEWLRWMPASRAAALVCFATGEGAPYWDAVFTLADRVDRADPARAQLAPLRTRVNLLATAAGARLEADLWPHLRGVTAGLLANPEKPSELAGACLALHLDQEAAAEQLVRDVLPRLVALRNGFKASTRVATEPRSLGKLDGRPLAAASRGRTVIIAWGEGLLSDSLHCQEHPEQSLLPDVASVLENAPDRLGAFWPGRLRLPIEGLDGSTPLERSLAEGSPIVWTGWNEGELARDRVTWPELRPTIHRFLARIPLQQPDSP